MSARALATVVVLAAAAAACSGARPPPTPAASSPIPDTALGLSKGSVFEVATPPAPKRNASVPGELPVLPRAYSIAPPRIPHAIDDFLPITQKDSACMGCHGVKGDKQPGQPTPIPASHYVDLRRTPGKPQQELAGSRWVCTACHVPSTETQPLAGSAVH